MNFLLFVVKIKNIKNILLQNMGIVAQGGQNFMPEMDPNVWIVMNSSRQINIFKKFYTDAVTLRHKYTGIQIDQYQV